jgi:ABC-type uncharacterized transport system substrate-binding protein
MRRREFIAGLGAAAVVWRPRAAVAQQGRLPAVGVLRPNSKDILETFAEPFRRYMKAIGWEEGRNIRFLFVWTESRNERANALAGELVAQNVDLIIAFGDQATRAAQRATRTIPIVAMTDDMVGSGLAASMARPGGNTTGVSILASELNVKRLEILHEFVPQRRRIAVLADSTTISSSPQLASAARDLGASRKRGDRLAARRARAAAGDAGDRVPPQRVARHVCKHGDRVPPRPQRNWLCRRPECEDRVPLGGGSI